MKKQSILLHILSITLILVSFLLQAQDISGQNTASYLDQLKSIKENDGNEVYYNKAWEFSEKIFRDSKKHPAETASIANSILLDLLATPYPESVRVQAADLKAMRYLILTLLNYCIQNPKPNPQYAATLNAFLKRVNDEFIPNYVWKPVYDNVAPPPGVPAFSGMSPKYVKDPVKRAEYERAIQKNAENNNLNDRQSTLKDFKESFSERIDKYVKAANESLQ